MVPSLTQQYYAVTLGRLRRAFGAPGMFAYTVANDAVLLVSVQSNQNALTYVCVQVDAGQPVPQQARFGSGDAGRSSAMHNFALMGQLFEQVLYPNEVLYVSAELVTRFLVQTVSVQCEVER